MLKISAFIGFFLHNGTPLVHVLFRFSQHTGGVPPLHHLIAWQLGCAPSSYSSGLSTLPLGAPHARVFPPGLSPGHAAPLIFLPVVHPSACLRARRLPFSHRHSSVHSAALSHSQADHFPIHTPENGLESTVLQSNLPEDANYHRRSRANRSPEGHLLQVFLQIQTNKKNGSRT